MKYHKPGDLKQQRYLLWQLWRLEVQNQGGSGAILSPKAPGKSLSSPLLSFWWLSSILGLPWLVDVSPPSESIVTWHSLWASVFVFSSFCKDTSRTGFRATLTQQDLILLNYVKVCFQVWSQSQVHGIWTSVYLLWGTSIHSKRH